MHLMYVIGTAAYLGEPHVQPVGSIATSPSGYSLKSYEPPRSSWERHGTTRLISGTSDSSYVYCCTEDPNLFVTD